jgi:hypothetical protein
MEKTLSQAYESEVSPGEGDRTARQGSQDSWEAVVEVMNHEIYAA